MKWIIAITSSIFLNVFLILWGRGSFASTLITIGAAIWVGVPLLVLSTVLFLIARYKNSARYKRIFSSSIAVALIIASTLISIPIGTRVLAYDVRKAMVFCEDLIPELELSKHTHGVYPQDITVLLDNRRLPDVLNGTFYQSDGTGFTFTISNPGTIMGGKQFSSRTGEWSNWD